MLIVTLTTIPPRLKTLQLVVDSIRAQSVPPDKIEINIPIKYRRSELGQIDKDLKIEGCDIFFVSTDLGPATKILPTLERYKGKDVKIVYCDDDRKYDENWLMRLADTSKLNPTCCIAENAMNAKRRLSVIYWRERPAIYRILRLITLGIFKPSRTKTMESLDIVEGYGGCLVKPSFFNDAVFNVPEEFMLIDDIWLSGQLALNGTSIVLTNRKRSDESTPASDEYMGKNDIYALKDLKSEGKRRRLLDMKGIEWFKNNYKIWL